MKLPICEMEASVKICNMETTCLNISANVLLDAFSKHHIDISYLQRTSYRYIINVKIKMRNSTANSDYITLQKEVVEVCKSQLRSHFMLF